MPQTITAVSLGNAGMSASPAQIPKSSGYVQQRSGQHVDQALERAEQRQRPFRSCFSYGRARMATAFLPLEGVRVVDVTSSLAGPYCTEILGALGADVVKVEHPERGDEARAWGPAFFEGSSVMFYAANLNKRSLALDIKRGREVLLRLVDRADVFLQSLRPGTATGSALARTSSARRNPRLTYCDIGAFGRAGPLRERPGYDPVAAGIRRTS